MFDIFEFHWLKLLSVDKNDNDINVDALGEFDFENWEEYYAKIKKSV